VDAEKSRVACLVIRAPFVMHKSSYVLRHGLRASARRLSTAAPSTTQITTLPNGIRVATEATPGHFAALGLYVDAGSRYETPLSSGTSHFLDRMAFKVCGVLLYIDFDTYVLHIRQTTSTRSAEEMSSTIDKLGGQIMASSSRESIMYQSCHFPSGTPLAMSIIADSVLNPSFLPEEIDTQRDAARYEIREIGAKPEMILPEVLHAVAYQGGTLGNPLLCPEERIDLVDEKSIRTFMHEMYRPERIVIAGAGMQHEELVELADKHFSLLKGKAASLSDSAATSARAGSGSTQIPSHLLSQQSPSVLKSLTRAASFLSGTTSVDTPATLNALSATGKSVYTGGHRFIHNPDSEFNHVYLAFEGVDIHDDDIYALATMQVLLGGGGSFSAGQCSLQKTPKHFILTRLL
jgi:processing peptidase subunit alpha